MKSLEGQIIFVSNEMTQIRTLIAGENVRWIARNKDGYEVYWEDKTIPLYTYGGHLEMMDAEEAMIALTQED